MTVTSRIGVGLLTMALGCVPGAAAAQGSGPAPPAAAGPAEGIKVHGRWTIEVTNLDGSLASRHEFDNALIAGSGDSLIAGLLGRFFRHAYMWQIVMATSSPGVCATAPPGVNVCPISEHLGAGPAPMGTLTVEVPTTATPGAPTIPTGGVELRAMTQFLAPGSIQSVATLTHLCREASCAAPDVSLGFTSHVLPAPIPVAADQVVQVRVVFTFS